MNGHHVARRTEPGLQAVWLSFLHLRESGDQSLDLFPHIAGIFPPKPATSPPMLSVNNLTYRIQGRLIFDGASASVMDGWKIGIVGLNGTGKTTLFKLIMKELENDGGEINISARHRIGIVRQDM